MVQFPNGDARPGVFETEAAACAAMYVPVPKIQAFFVRGAPMTEERVVEIARLTGEGGEIISCEECGVEIERNTPDSPFERGWRLRASAWFCSPKCIKSHDDSAASDVPQAT